MTQTSASDYTGDHGERVEHGWAAVAVTILVLLVVMATFAALHLGAMPQSRVETADPTTLHLRGEFIDSNLGSGLEPDGSVTVRAIGQQYSFTPSCILVPTDTPVTFRATSEDVVHGFLIDRTNINLMLVPGYISSLGARFETPGERLMPCHEFCSVGHEGMWGRIKIIDKAAFARLAADRRRLNCVE
ncbi:MAG: cytochrome c oxidase subunit II [Gammaproteobacteria bacterium]|nr:cytochrome c oxidase subunit II [Gammaproteobacteria bacterium]